MGAGWSGWEFYQEGMFLQRIGFLVNKRPEYRLNLATVARLNDIDSKPHGRRCRRHIPHRAFRGRRLRIDK